MATSKVTIDGTVFADRIGKLWNEVSGAGDERCSPSFPLSWETVNFARPWSA